MAEPIRITRARLVTAPPHLRETGLLGWLVLTIDDVLVADGLTLRRTADGREFLAYPRREDAHGDLHFILRPTDEAARQAIEAQVFELLGRPRRQAS